MQSLLADKFSFLFPDSPNEDLNTNTVEFYEKFVTNEAIDSISIVGCEIVAALFPKKYTVSSRIKAGLSYYREDKLNGILNKKKIFGISKALPGDSEKI